jgi:hypothetical protein
VRCVASLLSEVEKREECMSRHTSLFIPRNGFVIDVIHSNVTTWRGNAQRGYSELGASSEGGGFIEFVELDGESRVTRSALSC